MLRAIWNVGRDLGHSEKIWMESSYILDRHLFGFRDRVWMMNMTWMDTVTASDEELWHLACEGDRVVEAGHSSSTQ
jgi:hypothetical protein